MQAFYFDYKILNGEAMSAEERKLRRNLQRNVRAEDILRELSAMRGLSNITSRTERRKERA